MVIFTAGTFVIFKNNNLFSQTFPNCSSLAPGTAITPDQNPAAFNCHYLGKPPCKTFIGTPIHRVNCADIIDLPLCSIIQPATNVASGVNCVKEAREISAPNPSKVRGVDYAVHNKDSIRFCGQIETCNTAAGEQCNTAAMASCIKIKCHHLTAAQTPDKNSNCDIIGCNLLTLEELKVSDNKFLDDSKEYCDGSAKCYNFFNNANINELDSPNNNSDNLAFIRHRTNKTMCQIHQCPPDSALCGADDTLVFKPTNPDNTNNPSYKGETYKADYIRYINGNMPVESGLCKPLSCKVVTMRQYRCTPMDDENPTILNNPGTTGNYNCELCVKCADGEVCPATADCPAGKKKQECSGGFCNKIIDCNLALNNNQPECLISNPENQNNDADIFNAWFYRPTPPDRTVDNNGLISGQNDPTIRNTIYDSIKDDFCYDFGEVSEEDVKGWGRWDHLCFGLLGCSNYYWHYSAGPTRSPELCSTSHLGNRAIGYFGLHGVEMNIFKNPDNDVGYIKGIAGVNYELEQPEYRITSCLRYTNTFNITGATGTLGGKRDCRFDISDGPASSPIKTQRCGYDVCREMKLSQEDVDRCSMKQHEGLFDENGDPNPSNPDCVSGTIDNYVRMRLRKYGRMLCVFVDHKGAVAYNGKNFNGTETIVDKSTCANNDAKVNGVCPNGFNIICVDGDKDADGKCQGKNTNDNKGEADKWRTVKMIKYIGNNRGNQKPGYIDMNGQFFPEQDCAKIPLRIGPPRLYNVATNANSKNLFEPPLFVLSVQKIRGGSISNAPFGQQFGQTDFYQPEIIVQYGAEQQRMSLGTNFIGNDATPEDFASAPWTKEITTSINGLTHTASAFIKKEYRDNISQPLLCVYRNVVDQFGMPLDPIKLTCVQRTKPEIRTNSGMRVLITPDANNVFNSAKLKLRLIAGYGANNVNDNCTGDDVCSKEIVFENTNVDTQSCSKDIESYKLCSQRDECSKLLYECANNQIALNNALFSGGVTGAFETVKTDCDTAILSSCNAKFGIVNSGAADFLSQIDNSIAVNPNYQNFSTIFNSETKAKINPKAYGWFNEICIVSGFEDKLKSIIAYKVDSGLGKCQIDTIKSLYTQSVCDTGGGKAPYCICQEAPAGYQTRADEVIRKETPREAGLCIDIPLPKFCPAIDYTAVNSDDDYVISSITNSHTNATYNDASGVHTSHRDRTNSTFHHAEYSSILGGSNGVVGICKGFWKNQTNSQGSLLLPRLNCAIHGTNVQWENVVGNDCERYSCPEIFTDFSNTTNSYINNYADSDAAGNEGASHGFALWHKKTKSSDFLETQETAYQCITGFKPDSSGLLPKRFCNQKGDWEPISSHSCQRITCPAQFAGDGTLVANPTTEAQMNAWIANGGATFPTTNASKSTAAITPGSTAAGTCNSNLGFFKLTNANDPTRTCDSLGNWSTTVSNPCVSLDCAVIGPEAARQDINGFALWPRTTNVPAAVGGFINVKATSCSTKGTTPDPTKDWTPNPYGPIDPLTGQLSLPTRHCSSVVIDNGFGTVWDNPILNKCVDKCQGADSDPAHGTTSEKISTGGGLKTINWNSTDFGKYDFQDGPCANMNASLFTQGRTNGCYRLRRLCGDGVKKDIDGVTTLKKGEWGKAEPMCVANNGRNGDATYLASTTPATTGSANAIIVGNTVSGVCVSGFAVKTGVPLPIRQCVFEDTNNNGTIETTEKNIDKVYFKLASGSQECLRLCVTPAIGTDIGDGSKFTETAGLSKFPGDVVTLACRSNFGGAVGGSGGDSACGRNASDRSSTKPSTTCLANGTWNTTVANDCTMCRNCNSSTPFVNNHPTNDDTRKCRGSYDCGRFARHQWFGVNGYDGNMSVNVNLSSIANGSSASGSRTKNGSCNRDAHGRFTITCKDGMYFSVSNCD